MNKYEKELQELKPWDEVQGTESASYDFITTAGHGYLVVPVGDDGYSEARRLCKYGFIGELAVYLEEDVEAPRFLSYLKGTKKVTCSACGLETDKPLHMEAQWVGFAFSLKEGEYTENEVRGEPVHSEEWYWASPCCIEEYPQNIQELLDEAAQ